MTKASSAGTSSSHCPRCGAPASGAFCASCGAALAGASCRNCQAPLSSGARFCHRCGTSAGGSHVQVASPHASGARRDPLPWAVAAIALVALIALIAGNGFFGARQAEQADLSGASAMPRGPDLSRMTPREITDRLFDRIMALHEAGLGDSVRFLALNMAIPAFDMHDSLDADLRYDLGRIAEVSGVIDLARAQADTILRDNPKHLLGLALSARLARVAGDTSRARSFDKRLIAAEKAELALGLREYAAHKSELDSALAIARRGGS